MKHMILTGDNITRIQSQLVGDRQNIGTASNNGITCRIIDREIIESFGRFDTCILPCCSLESHCSLAGDKTVNHSVGPMAQKEDIFVGQ